MTKDIKDKSKTTGTEKSIFEKLEKYLKNLKSHGCLQTHPPYFGSSERNEHQA